MQAGGLKCPVEQDLRGDIWVKLLGIISFNPISAPARATMRQMCLHGGTRRVIETMMRETLAVAEALGCQVGVSVERRSRAGFEEYRKLVEPWTLSFRSEFDMRAAGTWDESKQSETTTVCAYCGVGRNLTLHVQDNEIVKVTSPLDNPVTHGNLCIKGRFGYQHVQNRG